MWSTTISLISLKNHFGIDFSSDFFRQSSNKGAITSVDAYPIFGGSIEGREVDTYAGASFGFGLVAAHVTMKTEVTKSFSITYEEQTSLINLVKEKGFEYNNVEPKFEVINHYTEHPELWESSGTVSRALASQQWSSSPEAAQFNQTGFSALSTGYVISYARHTELSSYEEQVEQRWTQRGNAYYWSTDHNDYYPRPYIPIESPWAIPQWDRYGSDSTQVQSYVLLLNTNQETPEISSLPDIHYCAIRCVKN